MVERFSQLCRETIGEYVYALVDPRSEDSTLDAVFYVGKGTGDRCHAHARTELKATEVGNEHLKLSTIREIRNATGEPPPVFIVAHSQKTEEAFRLEAILIATLDVRPLTNAVRGQGDREVWLPADEVGARYASAVPRSSIPETVLFVSLNGVPTCRRTRRSRRIPTSSRSGRWPGGRYPPRTPPGSISSSACIAA